jgi:hypothetical protein
MLAVDCLAVGCWLLAVDCWLLAVDGLNNTDATGNDMTKVFRTASPPL